MIVAGGVSGVWTAIGPQPNGPLIPGVLEAYKEHTGRDAADDFPEWEPCHRAILSAGICGFENIGVLIAGRYDFR